LKLCPVIEKDNIASVSMNNGEFVSSGKMEMHIMWRLLTIIEEII